MRSQEVVRQESGQHVDSATLAGKVLCGYQGWFRCPGDGTEDGWRHWSRRTDSIAPDTVTFEMWPDMSEYCDSENYPAGPFTLANGQPATLFSSANPRTVQRHFEWMADYGLDGAILQRFVVELGRPSLDVVLKNVRSAAAKTGRTYAICYDMSGARPDQLETFCQDWRRLVDELGVTRDEHYLHHSGKPVVMVWGFFSDRFSAQTAHRIIDQFKSDERHPVTLIGGCQWYWRNETNAEWARAFRRFDVISPWNVGNHAIDRGNKVAATRSWQADQEEASKSGMDFMPVIYPGFGWTNLQRNVHRKDRTQDSIPRRRGEFFRRQFKEAAELGVQSAYVAMFDEVDEATAIFKITNEPPTQGQFETLEGLPSDHYLKLMGEGTTLIRQRARP